MTVTIKTNRNWRKFSYRSEVPAKVLESQFSHLSDDNDAFDNFFQYRGTWYHLSDFLGASDMPELKGWDGYSSDSYFSGVVVKVSRNGERYKVGTYFSTSH